jgi:thymidylate kinase
MEPSPPASPDPALPLIGIVGPCSAGKSTLARGLVELGLRARAIGQEHSYVPHMWQTLTRPDLLVFLDVSFDVAQARRWLSWQPKDLDEQHRRLGHARQHSHFYLDTDSLSIDQVRDQVLAFVNRRPGGQGPGAA